MFRWVQDVFFLLNVNNNNCATNVAFPFHPVASSATVSMLAGVSQVPLLAMRLALFRNAHFTELFFEICGGNIRL